MITPSFSLTATERVLPRLALDFTTASLDPRITFTRALNTATRVNSSGYVEVVNADLPRFDYNPVTLACKGLLIEESRINTFFYSEDVASWTTLFNLNTGTATQTSPRGVATSKYIEDTAATSTFRAGVGLNFVTSTTYTLTVYLRQRTSSLVQLWFDRSSGRVNFNLANGTITASDSGAVGRIEPANDGWYRCSITQTASGTGSGGAWVQIINASNAARASTYTGTGANSIYVDCAQMEVGAFPTSYIPNTASTGSTTRNADLASMTGTNFSSWYNTTANTFFAQWSSFSAGSGTNPMVFTVSDGTTNNLAQLYVNNSTTIIWNVRSGAADSCSLISAASTANTTYKASMTSAANSFAASLNSLAPSTDNTGAVPVSPDRMGLGNRAGSLFLNGYLQKLSVYPQRLINAELQATSK